MQLPITGHPLHTRSLTVVLTRAEDGRTRARGVVNDLRKCGFVPLVHGLQPAGIIHQMSIDLVLDSGDARIEALETDQPFVAIEPSEWTKGECCRDPVHHLDVLVGERIDADFPKKLSAAFGGPRGCSHMLTLFQLMASVIPRALAREAELAGELGARRRPGERIFWRSCFVDGYEAEDDSLELAVQLHDFHGRPDAVAERPLDRFQRQEEVRVFARVASPSLALSELHAFERTRERPTLRSAEWRSRDAEVAPLAGGPIIPGLAGRIFEQLGRDPGTVVLRDALLQLAPGLIQVMAAITDRWFVEADRDPESASAPVQGPPVGAIGGMTDSCWMWRRDGALGSTRPLARSRDDG